MATAAALWPEPAVWTDVGELMLLVFTQDGVPTWEVNRRAKAGRSRDALIASGTADTFEAAKAAALLRSRGAVLIMRCTVIQQDRGGDILYRGPGDVFR
jgi:lipoate-protein ligase B